MGQATVTNQPMRVDPDAHDKESVETVVPAATASTSAQAQAQAQAPGGFGPCRYLFSFSFSLSLFAIQSIAYQTDGSSRVLHRWVKEERRGTGLIGSEDELNASDRSTTTRWR